MTVFMACIADFRIMIMSYAYWSSTKSLILIAKKLFILCSKSDQIHGSLRNVVKN